jgi:hypothetical protein
MTNKQANSKAIKLFNKWCKEFRNSMKGATPEYYQKLEEFKKECKQLHDVVGIYSAFTDKNALKMASICSSTRFVEPYRMLMQLQHTTKTY